MSQDNILTWPLGTVDFTQGCIVMGILNVTPDSFSDGGRYAETEIAVKHGLQMIADGAAIIDIGPESTRPGAEPVSVDTQIRRAIPVIESLAKQTSIPISIDTRDHDVAVAAVKAGASIINNVTGFADDRLCALAAETGSLAVVMHMQGTPGTMQKTPEYKDVVAEVLGFLTERGKKLESFGVPSDRIIIDPGIGFGKTFAHNLQLLNSLERFIASGYRLLAGTSRKRFIGQITGKETPADRAFGTAAAVAISAMKGADIVRVHDVPEMVDVVKVTNAIIRK